MNKLFTIREINDELNNESVLHKLFRLIIRLIINNNLNTTKLFSLLKIFALNNTDIKILIDKNSYYYSYIKNLKKGNLFEILKIKHDWANYIIARKTFHKKNSIKLALNYKDLLNKYYKKQYRKVVSSKRKKIDFYIYGPNSKTIPNIEYFKSTLILTKFPNFSIKKFNKKIIFLNSYTLNNTDSQIIKKRCMDYDLVYVPRGHKRFIKKMKYIPDIASDNLGSPMGLTKILYSLKSFHKQPNLMIEGFDLGIYKNAYSGKIKTFYKIANFENDYRFSLMHHDFVYNFLMIKDLLKNFKFYKSNTFLEIMNQDLEDYFDKIYKVRNFKNFT